MDSEHDTAGDAEQDGLSRRGALGYGGAVVAGAAASQLVVGQAAAAAGAAGAAGRGRSVEQRTISLAQADRVVAAGVRYVKRHPAIPAMYILVVDASGEEKASQRMDDNAPASVSLVPAKARTARAFRTATADLAERTTDPARIASFTTAGFSLLGGGRPIFEGDQLIGAIGVGGGSPEQDDEVAGAALRAL
jgi:glc operon protein GlcG